MYQHQIPIVGVRSTVACYFIPYGHQMKRKQTNGPSATSPISPLKEQPLNATGWEPNSLFWSSGKLILPGKELPCFSGICKNTNFFFLSAAKPGT